MAREKISPERGDGAIVWLYTNLAPDAPAHCCATARANRSEPYASPSVALPPATRATAERQSKQGRALKVGRNRGGACEVLFDLRNRGVEILRAQVTQNEPPRFRVACHFSDDVRGRVQRMISHADTKCHV